MTNTLFAQDQRLGVAGNIAFVSNEPDSFLRKLYIINPEGSGRRALTPDAGEYRDIAWSPDGTQLAFTAYDEGKRAIWVVNADGTELHAITSVYDSNTPAWSPDGRSIAFQSSRDGNIELYVMNSDGSDIRRLTDSPGNDLNPVWSPDGRRIAFTTFRDGDKEVYVMDADGSNARNISNEPLADDDPQWSPDSTRVSFISYQDGETDILLVNADGTDKRNLTQSPEIRDNRAAWSPDGQHIAFVAQLPDGNKEIFVMLADGSGQINLTDSADEDLAPSWAPDSWYIAFLSAPEEGPSGIFQVRLDGSGLRRLTDDDGDGGPSWSPGAVDPLAAQEDPVRAALASCPPDFAGFLAPHLYIGATAQVIAGQSANRVRTLPSANIDQIGSLEAEQPFDVLAGPACDPESGIIWWRIRTSSGLAGWTAEGVLPDEYFLEVISSE